MTYFIDTNCILRYLTNDIPEQAKAIENIFREAKTKKHHIIVPHIVVVEVMFHLEHWYKQPRKKAAALMMTLLSAEWMDTPDKSTLLTSLEHYKSASLDFVDLLLFSFAYHNSARILSFDKDFDSLLPKLRIDPTIATKQA